MTFSVPSDLRFKFTLARDLGWSVAEIDNGMTTLEYRYWRALYSREATESEKKK